MSIITRNDLKNARIDCHTHLGAFLSMFFSDKMPSSYDIISLLDILDANGMTHSVVFPFPSYYCGTDFSFSGEDSPGISALFEKVPYLLQNKRIALEISTLAQNRLMFFPMFSINHGIDEQLENLEKLRHDGLLYGLKYYSDSDRNEIGLLRSHGREFLDYAEKNNLPMVFHTSEYASLYNTGLSNAMEVVELASDRPGLRVCIAHMAHFSKHVLVSVEKLRLRNLYFDLSPFLHICNVSNINSNDMLMDWDFSTPSAVLENSLSMFPDNLIWGSDMPFSFTCNLKNPNHNKQYKQFSYKRNIDLLDQNAVSKCCNTNALDFIFGEENSNAH